MDAIFAILVLGAVIFFGALISAGNERQRKAIDGIREQAAQWAMQDLRLKREHLARDVKVDDPVAWLNRVVAKVVGEDLGLVVTEVFDNPQALICSSKDGRKAVLSPLAPMDISKLKSGNKARLSRLGNNHPLILLNRDTESQEISILNGGILFDLEMPLAWKFLSGLDADFETLWLYL